MRLDRNIEGNEGRGKYALVKLRRLREITEAERGTKGNMALRVMEALTWLQEAGVLDLGDTVDSEFFVIRLRDQYARNALEAYAREASSAGDDEYADDVREMAARSGGWHPNMKVPD